MGNKELQLNMHGSVRWGITFILILGAFFGFHRVEGQNSGFKCAKQAAFQHALSNGNGATPSFTPAASNSRSDSVDVLHYTIALDVTDFTNKTISGSCTIDFVPKVNGITVLYLDLMSLTISTVKWTDNSNLSFTHNGDLVAITLPATVNVGDTNSVTVAYSGSPVSDPSTFGGFLWNGNYAYNIGVGFTVNPHTFGRCWFPCFDNFVERSTYTFKITTDGAKRAYCNGILQSETSLGGGKILRTWQMDESIPTYLACMAVGEYTSLEWTHQGINGSIPVQLAAASTDTASLRASFANLDTAIAIFEEAWGEFRWSKVGYSLVPFNAGAMEHATNIAYPRFAIDGTLNQEVLMAHELAHHWWGDLVTCETAEQMWLNEGWAKYAEHLFTERVYGREDYLTEVSANHYDVMRNAHESDSGYLSLDNIGHYQTYGDHAYNKGALVAHILRTYLGDSLYFSGLTAFLDSNQFSDISNIEFRDELSMITGYDLTDFFDGWVLNPGYPHFSVDSVNVTQNGGNYDVYLRVHQSVLEAPSLFSNVPLQIEFLNEDFTSTMTSEVADGAYSEFNFTLSEAPVSILLNSEYGIGQAITFDEKMIYSDGNIAFGRGNALVKVENLTDSMLLRTEYHMVGPNPLVANGYTIADQRYWSFYGNFPSGSKLSCSLAYNGTDEATLATGATEDSLVLLYRTQEDATWKEYPYYSVNMLGDPNDFFGMINIDSILQGDFAFGRGQSRLGVKEDFQEESAFLVFPNPVVAHGKVDILNLSKSKNVVVQLFSADGALLSTRIMSNKKASVNVWNLPSGIYYVVFSNENDVLDKQKIIIQNQ